MHATSTVALTHFLGYLTSCALYALLAVMVARTPAGADGPSLGRRLAGNRLALATAVLGLVWNAGALVVDGLHDLGISAPLPWVAAPAYAALGLLPAVVVHAALGRTGDRVARLYVWGGYALSCAAALLHLGAAATGGALPSRPALFLLTGGYAVLMAGLLLQHRRFGGRRTLTVVALAVFAVSAFHLGQHAEEGESWVIALAGHHASLPLALVILYQDYRFALADVFLRRALALVALVALAAWLYFGVADPVIELLPPSLAEEGPVGVLLALWVATALVYPLLNRLAGWFVDRVILRRVDYSTVRRGAARQIEGAETEGEVLDAAAAELAPALHAVVRWESLPGTAAPSTALLGGAPESQGASAQGWTRLAVPTTDAPAFALEIGPPAAGRRLLSDDLALIESVALLAGRRVDALRVTHERCERDVREAEMRRLASEAELGALRAQLNPHFLFNTLNTLGYLMEVAPARARETLHNLTDLLRAVLYRSQREFCTLGEELEVVRAYLSIEKARFEERLGVELDVPEELRAQRVPPLLLQPLVENAVKHGISPVRAGGVVTVTATLDEGSTGARLLRLVVRDTGRGLGAGRVEEVGSGGGGVGLANLERRLARYYGDDARLDVRSAPGGGTIAEVWLPASDGARPGDVAADVTADVTADVSRDAATPSAAAARVA
ncbi:MAG TPA: histidine kinase [Gemmatimonadales bacterium]